jgi:M6 family metalloprotease-like protein
MKRSLLLAIFALIAGIAVFANSAPLWNYPQKLTQPDGSVIQCFASGDEFHHWVHDKDNYTIVQHPATGYYVYALQGESEPIPSDYIVGSVDPKIVGLTRGVHGSLTVTLQRRNTFNVMVTRIRGKASNTGVLNNIVIFIRFADESQNIFTDSVALYDRMFNASSAGANSMYNYYKEVSYGQLAISSTFYPIATDRVLSYQDTHVRNYYRPYNSVSNPTGYTTDIIARSREQLMLKNAVNAVAFQIPPGLNVDSDNDGHADGVCFVVSGDADGWAYQLWPHMDVLNLQSAYINGKRVWGYDFQLRDFLILPTRGVCALCHEMFHSLGAPDLYNYGRHGQPDELFPVWIWDVMGCKDQPNPMVNPPQHMCAYMKYKYGGWIPSIPTISAPGTFTLAPLRSFTNNCYKIPSLYSATEYFVVEYRTRSGTFEGSLPGEGLLVYRINSNVTGNEGGPPNEVYVYRPGGTTTTNGIPDSAGFSANSGRVELSDFTGSSSFLTDGSFGGLNLINVGPLGDSISFTLGPRLAATPHFVDYGNVHVGSTSDTVTVLLTNPDSVALSVTSIAHRSASYPLLGMPLLPMSVAPSGSLTFRAVFQPTGAGFVNDTIDVIGADQNHPLSRIILTAIGLVGISERAEGIPERNSLAQNYPNPFNPSTVIRYQLPGVSNVRLAVCDLLGREVAVLVNERKAPGSYEVRFDGAGLSSGVYFYRLQAGDFVQTRKLLLLR